MKTLFRLSLLFLAPVFLNGETMAQANGSAKADLEDALERFAAQG